MYRRFLFIFVLFLAFLKVSFASVVINEVQIETEVSKNDEYIELYNDSNTEVDLTGWSIYKKTSNGNESSFVAKSRFENKKIQAFGFIFLAREGEYLGGKNPDIFWPNSYSLAQNNSLTLYKDFENKIISDVVSWGEVKIFKQSSQNTQELNKINTNNSYVDLDTNNVKENFVQKNNPEQLQINTRSFGFVGLPIFFEVIILNQEYKNIYGKFLWNFGDGGFREIKSSENHKFAYTYFYPGKYNIYLEYYKNIYDPSPYLQTEISVDIVEQILEITKIGEENNFFIEITNKSNFDLDLYNYTLSGQSKNFVFPKNTFLKKGEKIILPAHIINLNFSDKNYLKLFDSNNQMIFDHNSSTPIANSQISNTTLNQNINTKNKNASYSADTSFVFTDSINKNEEDIFADINLKAQIEANESKQGKVSNFYFLFLLSIIGLGIASVYFIRKRKITKEEGVDFDILDE